MFPSHLTHTSNATAVQHLGQSSCTSQLIPLGSCEHLKHIHFICYIWIPPISWKGMISKTFSVNRVWWDLCRRQWEWNKSCITIIHQESMYHTAPPQTYRQIKLQHLKHSELSKHLPGIWRSMVPTLLYHRGKPSWSMARNCAVYQLSGVIIWRSCFTHHSRPPTLSKPVLKVNLILKYSCRVTFSSEGRIALVLLLGAKFTPTGLWMCCLVPPHDSYLLLVTSGSKGSVAVQLQYELESNLPCRLQ